MSRWLLLGAKELDHGAGAAASVPAGLGWQQGDLFSGRPAIMQADRQDMPSWLCNFWLATSTADGRTLHR